MKEDSYIVPENDTSKPPSDKELLKKFNEERMRQKAEDVEAADEDDEPTEMRLDGEVVEQDVGSDDEYEYEDVDGDGEDGEDETIEEPIPVTAEMMRPKDTTKDVRKTDVKKDVKNVKKDGKKKDTRNDDGVDSDLLALVTSQ